MRLCNCGTGHVNRLEKKIKSRRAHSLCCWIAGVEGSTPPIPVLSLGFLPPNPNSPLYLYFTVYITPSQLFFYLSSQQP